MAIHDLSSLYNRGHEESAGAGTDCPVNLVIIGIIQPIQTLKCIYFDFPRISINVYLLLPDSVLYHPLSELYIMEQICYVVDKQEETVNADCFRIREVYRCHF